MMKKGFTLIELMIVIAIIGILISIIVPNVIAYRNRHAESSDIVIRDKPDVKTAEPFPEKKIVEKAVDEYKDGKYENSESRY